MAGDAPAASTDGGSLSFVTSLLGAVGKIPGLGGGGRTSQNVSAVGGNANVSVNPTIVNNIGAGSPAITPSISADAYGSPYASGSSSAAGNDTPSYLSPGGALTSPLMRGSTLSTLTGTPVAGASSLFLPILIGGAAIAVYFLMSGKK